MNKTIEQYLVDTLNDPEVQMALLMVDGGSLLSRIASEVPIEVGPPGDLRWGPGGPLGQAALCVAMGNNPLIGYR